MMSISRVGREIRLKMAKRFESGELSKTKFCESESISVSTLDYWRYQLHAGGLKALLARAPEEEEPLALGEEASIKQAKTDIAIK